MSICLCLYSVFPIMSLLYSHPNWSDIIHHKPQLNSLSLFPLQSILHLSFLMSYNKSIFILTLSICLLGILGYYYLYQSSLLTVVTSHDTFLYDQMIISLFIWVDVLYVTFIYRLDFTLCFQFPFEMGIFPSQVNFSDAIFMFMVPIVLSVECVRFLSDSTDIRSKSHF